MNQESDTDYSDPESRQSGVMDLKNIGKSKTIHLSLTANYCPEWTATDAFREIIQNW